MRRNIFRPGQIYYILVQISMMNFLIINMIEYISFKKIIFEKIEHINSSFVKKKKLERSVNKENDKSIF